KDLPARLARQVRLLTIAEDIARDSVDLPAVLTSDFHSSLSPFPFGARHARAAGAFSRGSRTGRRPQLDFVPQLFQGFFNLRLAASAGTRVDHEYQPAE